MDKKYPFVMLIWLVIITTMLGTIVTIMIISMIWYFKYSYATCKVGNFLTWYNRKSEAALPATNQLLGPNGKTGDISSPTLISTTAATKDETHLSKRLPF